MSDTGIPPHTQPISTRSTPHTQTLLQTPTPQAHPSLSRRTVRLPLNSPATPLYLGTAVRSPRDYTPSLRREAATNEQSYTPTYTPSNRDPRIRRSLTRNSLGLVSSKTWYLITKKNICFYLLFHETLRNIVIIQRVYSKFIVFIVLSNYHFHKTMS